ncbi:MAG: hypothetical protein ACREM8_07075, partial [Vulcanimicrobiaceae bacterium]
FPWWIGGIVIFDIANAAAPIALTIFALRFLRREPTARRDRAEFAAIAAFVVLAGLNIEPDLAVVLAAQPSQAVENAAYLFIPLAYVAAALAFALSYLESAAAARGRLLWAIGGLCFQPIAIGAYYVMTLTALGNRIATITDFNGTLALETIATIFGPGIVAYAIVKRRVVDIRFIISRALVYSVLTAGIITTFGLVEWWVGQLLEKTRLALVLNLGIAIAVGFWLNGLHAGLDRLIDKLLFRRRHRAEERLVRVTAGLPHAESLAGLDEIVVCEPFEALELTSSAVFRRDSEVPFHRTASRGWTDADVVTLTSEHRWFVHLQGQQGPLRLRELPADQGFPHGDLAPVLAVPLVLRRVLIAIAFYGPHRSGEDLDADEVAAIARMGTAAALAYDAVAHDAVRTRVRPRDQALDELAEAVEAQARTIEAQQRTIADLRRERVAGAES